MPRVGCKRAVGNNQQNSLISRPPSDTTAGFQGHNQCNWVCRILPQSVVLNTLIEQFASVSETEKWQGNLEINGGWMRLAGLRHHTLSQHVVWISKVEG